MVREDYYYEDAGLRASRLVFYLSMRTASFMDGRTSWLVLSLYFSLYCWVGRSVDPVFAECPLYYCCKSRSKQPLTLVRTRTYVCLFAKLYNGTMYGIGFVLYCVRVPDGLRPGRCLAPLPVALLYFTTGLNINISFNNRRADG